MLKVSILATSSAGNCTFISSGSTRLLIDCGLSLAETRIRLAAIGEDLSEITAVLLTHSHSDHAGGLDTIARHWRRGGLTVPIYCTHGTEEAIHEGRRAGWPLAQEMRCVDSFGQFKIGDLMCSAWPTAHDCVQPTAFSVSSGDQTFAAVLDTGAIDHHMAGWLKGASAILLEANHDPALLRAGPYSYKLKQRIAETHLSNEAACAWIRDHMTAATRHLMLGHLSAVSNDPEIVRLMAEQALKERDLSTALQVILPGEGPTAPLVLG